MTWSCNGQSNEQWNVNADGTVTSAQSGLCLDVTGAATANGTPVQLWSCNGQSNQKWSLGDPRLSRSSRPGRHATTAPARRRTAYARDPSRPSHTPQRRTAQEDRMRTRRRRHADRRPAWARGHTPPRCTATGVGEGAHPRDVRRPGVLRLPGPGRSADPERGGPQPTGKG
ncbi:ricin-type beta-trefoil lectin domain protein [Streptomyces canarius]